ncbi:PEP/pyruvate-binding domain-containing protein [Mucilaginibacter paludis]|uniref:Pyruvate phosphate dikinase PEP/pyruvate-binding n=1 Tax=Mucilaginibacter paludis DSM 18603 TaxID=714943 RepID=H1Y1E4_9SPHI|nr:PEP/pyruvate-binding domain-containing protein [Mucilaginibacter paludis]EHQ30278.1 pyruvate phosphate dikinase PEP/pyruvate-binding [Mucilaginibacter paludis DSM 18603]
MMYPLIAKKESINNFRIGGKAANLFRLVELGIRVPQFVVLPCEVLTTILSPAGSNIDRQGTLSLLQQVEIPQSIVKDILSHFPGATYFAVRSSAMDEDGSDFSFAGQFESYLYVSADGLAEKIKSVWCSLFSDRATAYRENNKLPGGNGIAVIIQEMLNADVAGVAFGINPVNGDQHEKLINAVYGLGEGLVSGELNADLYSVTNGRITSQLAEKTHQVVPDLMRGSGIKQVEVAQEKQNIPALTDKHIFELAKVLDLLCVEYQAPQDIEFAVRDEQLYLLQARPVTGKHGQADSPEGYTVWDNSNIIESYPGVTTPLTFSFISQSYRGAYQLFCSYMGVSDKAIKKNERVFANTLGLINGRVYYNLKSWYHMLAMVPGYSINARFMESMMGVKERFDVPESYRLPKRKAFWQIIKMAARMYLRFLTLPQKRRAFLALLNTTIADYKKINFGEKSAYQLMHLYLAFESTLLNEWKAPLINDFFAMIGYGSLQKRCQKYAISKNPNIHNDLLCGSSDIISTQPIHRCVALATRIHDDAELKALFLSEGETGIWEKLCRDQREKYCTLKSEIDRYIEDFGERYIGELKLETISYTQDPAKFIRVLKAYVETEITIASTSGKIEEEIRRNAEQEIAIALKNKWYKQWKLKRNLKMARQLVSARENLRYERTRAFGMVREMFSAIGQRFFSDGIMDNPRDIFYLTKEEICAFIEGTSVTQNIRALIALRKKEFENYQTQQAPSERFSTVGTVYQANNFFDKTKIEKADGMLKGIGCCPGVVRARVRVITDPTQVSSLKGDILVTSSTDPGWVTLFPSASGIITERGSVLSHSAIVSREMGKPCIVSVNGLLRTLKTGDEIEMDGSTGIITRITGDN